MKITQNDPPPSQRWIMIFFWEFVQNFPLLLGFMVTLNYMQQQAWSLALFSSFVGSVLGAILIRYTESLIVPGEREAVRVTFINMAGFFIVMLVMAFYFVQRWGSWLTDTLLGVLIGFGLGYAQDLAAGHRKPGLRHILALAFAFAPALLLIRVLMTRFAPLFTAVLLCFIVTWIIVLIDYYQTGQNKQIKWNQNTSSPPQ